MNTVLIETFLAVVKNRSITQAASQLYVSQSTVSGRLQQLEERLGTPLIERHKGFRSIGITEYGLAFIPIAQRYMQVSLEMDDFQNNKPNLLLTIASPDSINIHLLNSLYVKINRSDTHLRLDIRTHQSPEICDLLDNREADIGFVFFQSRYNNIVSQTLLGEKMILMLSANGDWPDGPIHSSQLSSEKELYLAWSEDIALWHNKWWKPGSHPFIQVDTVSLLVNFLSTPGAWALCPISVAKSYAYRKDILFRECVEHIPERICYMITRKDSESSEKIQYFRHYLYDFIRQFENSVSFP